MSGFVSGPIEQRVFRNGWRDVFGIFVLAPLAIIAAAAVVLGNTTDPYEASDDEWTITVEPTEPVCSHDEWEMVWNNDVRRCKRCGHAEGIRVERS